ncbi:Hypothetical predicted protein [Cloeon dipterum]|uniref:Uncharacterized protein n=1 Tax=Cloeon dipterum TaxID=197152 RepID=A0A8S1D7L3_9INSE|nr:Hypothetical predicted protein [Cloeon dipterum]
MQGASGTSKIELRCSRAHHSVACLSREEPRSQHEKQRLRVEPPRLLDQAIKALYDNIDKYDKDLVKTIIGPFRQKMLKEILEMEENHHSRCDGREDQFAKEWAMLPFLINSKFYTKLDTHYFTRIYCLYATLSNSRFQEFIRCLGANTPYLRELNIYCPTRNGEYSLEERELNSIILLKNLAILTITRVSVPLSGIVDISRRCEKLKMLEASDVTIDVESSRVTFRNDFVYVYMDSRHFVPGRMNLWMDTTMQKLDPRYAENKQYTKLCLRPNKSSDFILVHMFAEKLSDIEIDFSRLKDVEEMNDFPLLPELKYAKMHCGGESANALRCFMKRNGETLQELSLEVVAIILVHLVWNHAPLSVDAMLHFKRFEWFSEEFPESFDKVAFSSTLSAPLLEDIHIDLPNIDFSDNMPPLLIGLKDAKFCGI